MSVWDFFLFDDLCEHKRKLCHLSSSDCCGFVSSTLSTRMREKSVRIIWFCDWMAFSHIINTFPYRSMMKAYILAVHKCSLNFCNKKKAAAAMNGMEWYAICLKIREVVRYLNVDIWLMLYPILLFGVFWFRRMCEFCVFFFFCCLHCLCVLSIVFALILMLRQGWKSELIFRWQSGSLKCSCFWKVSSNGWKKKKKLLFFLYMRNQRMLLCCSRANPFHVET